MYDLTTDAGKVRLLISDVDDANPVFADDEINTFLGLAGGVMLAAAVALETIAVNEALLLKYVRSRGLDLDGPAVARELRQQAKQWREHADDGDVEESFLIATSVDGYDFGYLL